MKTYLTPKKSGSSATYFLFRYYIPKDLNHLYQGREEFRISLKNVTCSDALRVSLILRKRTDEIFSEIREGMKSLTIEDIKEILRIEVRKQIEHSKHVFLGTNKHNEISKLESLKSVSTKEMNLRKNLADNLKDYEKEVDGKLESILQSLEIQIDKSTTSYKQLRMSFIDLYLLRYEWMKDLINQTGRTEDDFRRDVDLKLNMKLFDDLSQEIPIPKNVIQQNHPEISSDPNNLFQTPISKCVVGFLDEKGGVRLRTNQYIKSSLDLLIESFGDIPVSQVDKQKAVTLKSHMLKLPKNRRKNPELRDKHLHELVEMKFGANEKISNRTINEHLSYLSSFMVWCKNHGYAYDNPFAGLKLKRETRPRDERDRFSDLEIHKLFSRYDYLSATKVETGRFALYWIPLISLFSGMRLGEICPLYLDNIRKIKNRWCIEVKEEEGRTDKVLKTLSSRRVVPIHDTLMKLGLIEFKELLEKKNPSEERMFPELPYVAGHYNKNVSRFWNERYLKKLEIKTDKKNFHSLRHTVIDHLKQKGVELSFINELVGHSSGNIDMDRYGEGYNPEILYKKCVARISYKVNSKPIDFKSLKLDWKKFI